MREDYISASEVGEYLYCNRSWWYKRQGLPSANQPALEAGKAEHIQLEQAHQQTERRSQFAWVLLLVAAIAFVIILILQAQGGAG